VRRAKSIEELLPWLYLKGISTGDFSDALTALLGPDAPGLSASTITRLKADWWDDYERWSKRDLSAQRYVYFWADGVYFSPRTDEDRQCMLVIIGPLSWFAGKPLPAMDEYGRKELLAMADGFRESTQSWRELLLDLKRRGLKQDPKLAIHCPAGDLQRKSAERGRRCPGVLDRPARGVRHDAGTTLLGPQDHERAERDAEIRAG